MPAYVLWFYRRSQAVILWGRSSRISLLPLSIPPGEVILLKECSVGGD